jgi:hypothetical protein
MPCFFGFEVGEGIEFDSLVRDLILKIWFLDLDEKEVDNVIKGDRRVSKLGPRMHLMNGVFHSFDKTRSIANFLEDESFVKNLVDMLSFFVLQVAKINGSMYPPTS